MPTPRPRTALDVLARRAASVEDTDGLARSRAVLEAHRSFMLYLFLALAAVPVIALLLR